MEKSNKRRYTLIVISFLFLLVATFVTVYNFKDTRAEETDAVVSTSQVVNCPTGFIFVKDIKGCKMTSRNVGFSYKKTGTSSWTSKTALFSSFSSTNDTYYVGIDPDANDDVYVGNPPVSSVYDHFIRPGSSTDSLNIDSFQSLKRFDCTSNSAGMCFIINTSYADSLNYLGTENGKYYQKIKMLPSSDKYPRLSYYFLLDENVDVPALNYGLFWSGSGVNGKVLVLLEDKATSGIIIDRSSFNVASKEVKFSFDDSMSIVQVNLALDTSSKYNGISGSQTQYLLVVNSNSDLVMSNETKSKNYFTIGTPEKDGYTFKGWKDTTNNVEYKMNFNGVYRIPYTETSTEIVEYDFEPIWVQNVQNVTVKFNFSAPSNVSSANCICNGLDEICRAFDSNPTENFDYVVSAGSSIQLPTISCPGINKKIKDWSGNTGSFKPTANTILKANWESINSGNTPSNDEYTVTLNRNCSGTFVCSSTTNSEVCTQLKNNGKFTKTFTKGDTFVFLKTFDTLTCDGKEISSWGSFDLGYELNVTSDVTASAKWKSSSGGGNTPSNDEYTVTLNRNCSGTFVCNSTTNSSVCEQLKSNGKFIKTVTKGDTFIFPKTFDALTCDGKEISSWGSYSLGTNITVNKNIDIDAAWDSSNGGGDTPDPSQNDDPIDNPQTGSIVIYLVLLFGIGALVYSVWYFRGFREN